MTVFSSPRKKNKRKKVGTFRSDKSKGELKSTVCFADEFVDAPNFNDLPEIPEDSPDKHLALGDDAISDSSSDSSSLVPSLVASDCEEEEEVADETARLQEEYLQEVGREEWIAPMTNIFVPRREL